MQSPAAVLENLSPSSGLEPAGEPRPAGTVTEPRTPSDESSEPAVGLSRHPLSGRSFEDFVLDRPVGSGGIAELWLARHPEVPTSFVVKVARAELASNVHVRAQFEREWRATRILTHPGVLRHHSRGMTPDERPFLTMDLVVGRPLSHFVQRPVTWPFLRAALIQLCDILTYIHDRGVLHQDLKPSNILIDVKAHQVRITDFGLACFERAEPGTTTRSVLGTPSYMAPEQARGQTGLLGPHTELYTVGVLLFELLTGEKPFRDPTDRVVMIKHCTCSPPPLVIREGIEAPPDLEHVLERLLAKSHEARYPNAEELKAAIQSLS